MWLVVKLNRASCRPRAVMSPAGTDSPAQSTPAPGRKWGLGVLLAGAGMIAVIGWFYLWMARSSANPYRFEAESRGYYSLLKDGFLASQLSMKVDLPPEATATAAADLDSSAPPVGMHDASYYQGKYYLYFGVTPVPVLFLPFKVLTGVHCPENLAVALFCLAGFACSATLAALLQRRFLPALHPGWWLVAIAGLGMGNMVTVLLRRAAFWEVPISSAYACGSASLLCALLALTGRRPLMWLALASLCQGLAVGSRPVFAFAVAGLAVLWWTLSERAGWRQRWNGRNLRLAAAAFGPAGFIVLLLLWHNHARFEDPFELGMKWALTGYDMQAWKMFDPANLSLNAWYYFLSPAHWMRYFPFVQASGPAPVAIPPNYYGQDNVFGLLSNLPIVLFALGLAGWLFRRSSARPGALPFAVCTLALFATNTLVLLMFSAAAGRYMVDMAPCAVLLGLMGTCVGAQVLAAKAAWRRVWLTSAGLALGVTVVFNFFLGYQSGRIFELQNPDGCARAARFFNRLPAAYENLRGEEPGRLQLQVRFPRDRTSRYEPLVTTGWYFLGDILFVKYGTDDTIEFGFAHINRPAVQSPPVRIDYDAKHTLDVVLGSLYPPAAHSWFDRMLPQQAATLKRRLRVRPDGREVLAADTPFNESGRGDVLVGRNPPGFIVEKKFTGEVRQVRRVPPVVFVPADPRKPGPVGFRLLLPADRIGRAEPLVTTGVTGRGDVLSIMYEAPGRIRFIHDHWGHSLARSEPIEVDYSQPHTVEVWMGTLLSDAARTTVPWEHRPDGPTASALPWCAVRLDGVIIWAQPRPMHPADPRQAAFLQNPIGSTTCSPSFTGRVEGWDRPGWRQP